MYQWSSTSGYLNLIHCMITLFIKEGIYLSKSCHKFSKTLLLKCDYDLLESNFKGNDSSETGTELIIDRIIVVKECRDEMNACSSIGDSYGDIKTVEKIFVSRFTQCVSFSA